MYQANRDLSMTIRRGLNVAASVLAVGRTCVEEVWQAVKAKLHAAVKQVRVERRGDHHLRI